MKENKPDAKKSAQAGSVDEYLADTPKEARAALQRLRKIIRSAIPDAIEGISYRMPVFKYKGRPLVAMAAFKDHCSFFPMSPKVLSAHAAKLKGYELAKGTIHFSSTKPLPAALVTKIVQARIAENEKKSSGYGKKSAKT